MGYRSHMNMITKKDIFKRYLREYLASGKKRKGEILEIVCDVTGMHRNAAGRKFRKLQLTSGITLERRGRKTYYTTDATNALRTIWEAGSEVCGELTYPIVKEYVAILKRDRMWLHSEEATRKLLVMSEGTVKRRVGKFMESKIFRKGLGSTKPSGLKEIIPIFTGPWRNKPPGYGQIDTVVHCGPTLVGNMAYSVNYTDIALLWVSLAAQWNKGQHATKESLARIKKKIPFPLRGMHPDTGSEFINWYLKEWCDEVGIELSRSRPYHKDDNGYVEQKNGHVIRRFLEYDRLDAKETIEVINRLYDRLEFYLNHFVASRRCLKKVRIGSKYKKVYDKGMTLYQRLMACSVTKTNITSEIKDKVKTEHETLNPLLLKREVDMLIEEVFKVQRDYDNHDKKS